MTKLVNRISLVIFVAISILGFVNYHDDMDLEIPYLNYIMMGSAGVLSLFLFLKANYRWQALFIGKKAKKFYLISKTGLRKSIAFEGINIGFYAYISYMFLYYSEIGFSIGAVAGIYFLEGLFHLMQNFGTPAYRTIVQEHVITIINNDISVIPLNDITKVELKHMDICFTNHVGQVYKLDIELIRKEEREQLITELKTSADNRGIYFNVQLD